MISSLLLLSRNASERKFTPHEKSLLIDELIISLKGMRKVSQKVVLIGEGRWAGGGGGQGGQACPSII